jgi:hypothetical protein
MYGRRKRCSPLASFPAIASVRTYLLVEIVNGALDEFPYHPGRVIRVLEFFFGDIAFVQSHIEVTLQLLDRPMRDLVKLPLLLE